MAPPRRVRTVTYRNNHCLAQCTVCDWEAGIGEDGNVATVQRAARRHTQTTGHKVVLERSITTYYIWADDD